MKTARLAIALLVSTMLRTQAQSAGAPAWSEADIGAAPQPGGAQLAGAGGCIVTSTGAGIWGTGDAFHYVYQPLGTNGQLVAWVAGIQRTGGFVKAEVMVRETLDAGSRNALMQVTMGRGTSFQWGTTALSLVELLVAVAGIDILAGLLVVGIGLCPAKGSGCFSRFSLHLVSLL